MKKRRNAKPRKDRKIFRQTADKTRAVNINTATRRGGIRL